MIKNIFYRNLTTTTIKIYRNNNNISRIQKITFDKNQCGPMVLDALIHIKNNIDKH